MGVLATLGLPGLLDTVRDLRRDAHVGDIVLAFNLARSEAIRRGQKVVTCPSADGMACDDSTHWEPGWIVFVDGNANGQVDGDDAILRRQSALAQGITLRGARKQHVYGSLGASVGYADTLRVCDARGAEFARSVIVSNTGRVRVKRRASACP